MDIGRGKVALSCQSVLRSVVFVLANFHPALMASAQEATELFICYSRRDTPIVERVVAALEARGCRCWLDRHGIAGSDDWRNSTALALNSARAVLFFAPESSYQSRHVAKELSLAEQKLHRIIPLRLDRTPIPPGQFQLILAGIHYINFSTKNSRPAIEKIIEALASIDEEDESDENAPVIRKSEGFQKRVKKSSTRLVMLSLAIVIVAVAAGIYKFGLPVKAEESSEPDNAAQLIPSPAVTETPRVVQEKHEEKFPSAEENATTSNPENINTPSAPVEIKKVEKLTPPEPVANPEVEGAESPGKLKPALDGPIQILPPGS
jgi:hypothetical protein